MNDLLKVLDKISSLFGPIYGTIFVLMILGLVAILYFFYKRIDGISSEISSKVLSKFDKKIDILFRDETIRGSLRLQMANDSIKKKLELSERTFHFYFDYQKSWSFSKDTTELEIKELYDKMSKLREDIFVNSCYLGGYLAEKLVSAVVNMHADINRTIRKIKSPYAKVEETDYFTILFGEIKLAEKWLQENIFPDQTIKGFEFTKEQIAVLDEEKKKFLEESI
jgi:hypothetical protein